MRSKCGFLVDQKGAIINLRRSLKMKSVDLKIKIISKQSIFYTTNVLIFSKYDNTMVFQAI